MKKQAEGGMTGSKEASIITVSGASHKGDRAGTEAGNREVDERKSFVRERVDRIPRVTAHGR